jgi:tetratricopeptide (TPR) repeat protein
MSGLPYLASTPKTNRVTAITQARLNSWKEIARYLDREVRTVQRWEKTDGLPVHRLFHDKRGSVFAYASEVDAWAASRTLEPVSVAQRPAGRLLTWLAVGSLITLAFLAAILRESRFSSGMRVSADPFAHVSAPAKDAYLQGIYYLNRGGERNLRASVHYLNVAEAANPGFAAASAELASAYLHLGLDGHEDPAETLPLAKASAQRALSLDGDNVDAHAVLAQVMAYQDGDWTGAEAEFQRALHLDPNSASGHANYAQFLGLTGQAGESIREAKRAVELEPLSALLRSDLAWYYYWSRRYDEAISVSRQVLASEPKFNSAQACIVHALIVQGRWKEAQEELLLQLGADSKDATESGIKSSSPDIGVHAYYEWRLKNLRKKMQGEDRVSPLAPAMFLAILHRKSELYECLRSGSNHRDLIFLMLNVDPLLDEERKDPEFSGLLRQVGLPSVQHARVR